MNVEDLHCQMSKRTPTEKSYLINVHTCQMMSTCELFVLKSSSTGATWPCKVNSMKKSHNIQVLAQENGFGPVFWT
jgi:hypothetical protein